MHYKCLWIDKDFVQFGKDPTKWAKKIDKFLDKETNDYWMIQGQSAVLGGRWTGWLECKSGKGKALKDAVTAANRKDKWTMEWLKGIRAFDVDDKHCDICAISDLVTKLDDENSNLDFAYGYRFFDKCKKLDESLRDLSREDIMNLINKKKIEGLIVTIDFHE